MQIKTALQLCLVQRMKKLVFLPVGAEIIQMVSLVLAFGLFCSVSNQHSYSEIERFVILLYVASRVFLEDLSV